MFVILQQNVNGPIKMSTVIFETNVTENARPHECQLEDNKKKALEFTTTQQMALPTFSKTDGAVMPLHASSSVVSILHASFATAVHKLVDRPNLIIQNR